MSENDYRFSGISRLYGPEAREKLEAAHVCVVGVGGVGSWCVEALARSGVGELTLIDLDDICVTNVNRQLHALDETIGQLKIEVLAKRCKLINPLLKVNILAEFFTPKSADKLLSNKFTYVVDAIDSIENKILLIDECLKRGQPILTTGAAAGKQDPTKILVEDLSKTWNDRLLQRVRKTMRQRLGYPRDGRPFNVLSVFCHELPFFPHEDGSVCQIKKEDQKNLKLDCNSGYGSATFVTGTFGFVAASEVVREICKK
ncbi:tRNA threonylcarbamoyladenosine dehydratase [Halobacteriovorax marinus]|uniref:tRNA threonylcarbamoyladenosine dehydratase n=1 Tax=Halobacteriovorax marinus TaxID=97084 RepID=A0A1Y5FCM9_9BACT|nr:tRNA threonylcarbamoyladenosine dehydratase [Halobacteriovorax marinus]